MKQGLLLWAAIVVSGMMTLGARTVEEGTSPLPIEFAAEYDVTNIRRESIPSPIPEQKPVAQLNMVLSRNEKEAYIFFWDGMPLRDLGPLQEQESWKTNFLGGESSVIRTTMFMGQQQEVLVLHHQFAENGRLMIYSKDMSKDEFHEMLSKMSKKPN